MHSYAQAGLSHPLRALQQSNPMFEKLSTIRDLRVQFLAF
jgi:hypothetical protein